MNGKGASKSTINRWNSKGTEIIYTSGSESLARAELAGHVSMGLLPDPVLIVIEVASKNIPAPDPPEDWDVTPPGIASKKVGDLFIRKGKDLVVKVPSKYDSTQFNYLINPNHPDFSRDVKVIEMRELK